MALGTPPTTARGLYGQRNISERERRRSLMKEIRVIRNWQDCQVTHGAGWSAADDDIARAKEETWHRVERLVCEQVCRKDGEGVIGLALDDKVYEAEMF